MNSFHVCILEAEGPFYDGPCESLIVPLSDGLAGIQAGHSNLFGAVVSGELTYRVPGGQNQIAAISAGFLKVEDGDVLLLAESIERPEEIDAERARREADRAKEEMLQKRSAREYRLAEMTLAKAANRLRVKGHSGR